MLKKTANNMDLSILIPARNEMFLAKTIEDILANIEMDTEVIAVLDGAWASPPIPHHERVTVVYVPESVGQRAATNLACKLAKGKYVAKVDAHTMYDKGFDRKMIEAFNEVGDNVIMVPIMRNLHAFDWKCFHCGWKKYQGPTPSACEKCGKNDKVRRKITWEPRKGTYSTSYSFDSEPHFQYFQEWKNSPQYIKEKAETGLTEVMSLQGSFFMCSRDKYWELNLSDESVGSWGNQGIELACKMWLSGGRVLVNHRTWYAHMFRTQGGDFSFPYEQSGRGVEKTKQKVWDFFFGGKFKQQIHPVSWLVRKFSPVPGWTEEAILKLEERERN
jgi:glycosyltransferase involved in cell wall biosynthesis